MYVAIVAVLVKGVIDAGGVARTWEINEDGGHIEILTYVLLLPSNLNLVLLSLLILIILWGDNLDQ